MIKIDLTDNTVDNFIGITPTRQQIVVMPSEEVFNFQQGGDVAYGSSSRTVWPGSMSNVWNGAWTLKLPWSIDPNFADFKLVSLINHTPEVLVDNTGFYNTQYEEELFLDSGTSKLSTVFPGQQLLRVPAKRFMTENTTGEKVVYFSAAIVTEGSTALVTKYDNTAKDEANSVNLVQLKVGNLVTGTGIPPNTTIREILETEDYLIVLSNAATVSNTDVSLTSVEQVVESLVSNYGKYYIKISPKYIDTAISSISYGDLSIDKTTGQPTVTTGLRKKVIYLRPEDFKNTIWNFEDPITQRGRLAGSIAELWSGNNGTSPGILKSQKMIVESAIGSTEVKILLYPQFLGWDTVNTLEQQNQVVRVYPRETYFDTVYIEINFKDVSNSLDAVAQYILNDASRDTKTGIIEVYDNNGIKIDKNGNINGKVAQSYQISQKDTQEIRVKLTI